MLKVKRIKVDIDKCTGCRMCEAVCSAYHYKPAYSIVNPRRSRIRVLIDEDNDIYVPIFAGPYTEAECNGRKTYTINGRESDDCLFCSASCPSRDLFKEPDSGLPLKCDMCGEPPPPEGPLCVASCSDHALIYVESEEIRPEEGRKIEEKERLVEYLVKRYGWKEIRNALERTKKVKGK